MVKEFIQKLFKFQEDAPVPQAPKDANLPLSYHLKRLSSSGTEIFSGYASEEYLTELRGYQRAKLFDQMRRSDPQIRMLLNAVKNPIRSASWEIAPADDSPEAKEDADFIQYVLFEQCHKPFKKFLGEVLTMTEFGHAVFEKTYQLIKNDPKYGTFHGIASLGWINPKTIHRFNVDKDTGRLVSITQIAQGDLDRYIDIPAEYLLLFSPEQEGSNYEGMSWLRPCYGSWIRKYQYDGLNATGIERFGTPTPTVKVPEHYINSEAYERLMEALEAYTSGQANFLAFPDVFELELGSNNTYDPEKVNRTIAAEDTRMAKAFVANFLELGTQGNGGAFALSSDQSDFYTAGLTFMADEVCEVVNKYLIPECVQYNRGPRVAYPQLKHFGISDKAGAELASVLGTLTDKKIIVPDDPLEVSMRKRYGLPVKSDQGQREVQAPAAPSFGLSERVRRKLYG